MFINNSNSKEKDSFTARDLDINYGSYSSSLDMVLNYPGHVKYLRSTAYKDYELSSMALRITENPEIRKAYDKEVSPDMLGKECIPHAMVFYNGGYMNKGGMLAMTKDGTVYDYKNAIEETYYGEPDIANGEFSEGHKADPETSKWCVDKIIENLSEKDSSIKTKDDVCTKLSECGAYFDLKRDMELSKHFTKEQVENCNHDLVFRYDECCMINKGIEAREKAEAEARAKAEAEKSSSNYDKLVRIKSDIDRDNGGNSYNGPDYK